MMLDASVAAFAAELPHSFASTPVAFAGQTEREPTVAERMAETILGFAKDGQATSYGDLANAGFTRQQIGAEFPKAKAIADTYVIRQDAPVTLSKPWEADAEYRRDRVDRAASLVTDALSQSPEVAAVLRRSGYTSAEIGDLWPEFMAEVGKRLAGVKS